MCDDCKCKEPNKDEVLDWCKIRDVMMKDIEKELTKKEKGLECVIDLENLIKLLEDNGYEVRRKLVTIGFKEANEKKDDLYPSKIALL
jgi:hypothetical protein